MDVASNLASAAVDAYIEALGKFNPTSDCGMWYKATYQALLLNSGKSSSKDACTGDCNSIFKVNGAEGSGNYSNCSFAIMTSSGLGPAAQANFQDFAKAAQDACNKAKKKNCCPNKGKK
jgi:hypothetical protein